ncbi:NAD-dependent epimerase/dehydratase family protein [Actinocorallia populi]|uniref:NAD-dependent epimerase/dehydratase family protein n=1 Tax=Actinocorallia populi TaxID=2079200 RepID=UPI001300396F|nr:NAD-dependent epimerase/dehydratase family protein [Actinocorallia populi]
MKVLVTGGTGFVGSHAVRELQQAGHDIRLLARRPERVAPVLGALGVAVTDVVAGDMTDPQAVGRALEGCSAVVHCAAEIGVGGGSRGAAGTANLDGARTVLGGAFALGLDPIVYTSTITVHLPSPDPVITIGTPLAEPLSTYGAQKRSVEDFVRDLQDQGAPITTLVVGGVYGPHSPHLDGSHAALRAALAAGMYAPASGIGVLDVRDLAAIITRVMRSGLGPRRYLASGRYTTWRQWSELLAEAAGRPVPYREADPAEMAELGRKFDELRASGKEVPPLSEEAAVIMASGRPGDDSRTLQELDMTYRPTVETFRDAVRWLADGGHLS